MKAIKTICIIFMMVIWLVITIGTTILMVDGRLSVNGLFQTDWILIPLLLIVVGSYTLWLIAIVSRFEKWFDKQLKTSNYL